MRYKLVPLSGECGTQHVNGYNLACQIARDIARREKTEVVICDPEMRTIVIGANGHRCVTVEEVRAIESGERGDWSPVYSPWRHGGWYVDNVHYPSGAVGCVSRNYADKKWRIVCDSRDNAHALYTYPNRDAAARAERELIAEGILG
jgi:hypothetical protein